MRRRPALCVLTSVLALVTALALLASAVSFSPPRVADPRSIAIEQVVRAFYAAVNQTIATGDPAALEGVAGENLVTHGALAAIAPGWDGLVRYLASLHTTHPQIELVVEQVVAARDQALVHLAVRGTGEGSFLGIPLRGLRPWGTIDALAVAGGRVIEYWSGASGLALLEPLGQTALALPLAEEQIVALDRLTLPPGGRFAATGAAETRLLHLETGTLTVVSSDQNFTPVPAQALSAAPKVADKTTSIATVTLTAGDSFVVPMWSQTVLRNVGTEPASLLVLAAGPSGGPGGWTTDPARSESQGPIDARTGRTTWPAGTAQISASGPTIAPLAGNVVTALPGERAVVAVGRMTLTAGMMLPLLEATYPRLLVVEEGGLDLDTSGGLAWAHRGANGHSSNLDAGTLTAGDGVLLHAGTGADLYNSGPEPVVVTLVAMMPGDAAMSGL